MASVGVQSHSEVHGERKEKGSLENISVYIYFFFGPNHSKKFNTPDFFLVRSNGQMSSVT